MQPSNILKIDSLSDGWCDKDHVLLHACFQLLCDFVEEEIPKYPFINWIIPKDNMHFVMRKVEFNLDKTKDENAAGTRDIKKEFEELYAWWQEWKKKNERKENDSFEDDHQDYWKQNEMLKRLIDMRMYMWT